MAATTLLLHELPDDALRHIFTHVEVPYVLKLACRALRAAGPKRTFTTMERVAKSKQSLRLAHMMRFPFTWDAAFACVIAQSGNLEALVWATEARRIPIDHRVACDAGTSGNLQMVDWLHAAHKEVFNSKSVARAAAGHGHFHIIRWLHSFGMEICRDTLNATARRGDFGAFLWLVQVVHVWPNQQCLFHAAFGSGMHKNGEHLKIIKFVRNKPVLGINQWPQDAFCTASVLAPIEMLKYMRNDGCDDPNPQLTLMTAAQNNRRDVIEWVLAEFGTQYKLNPRVTWSAARGGHIELLKWLRERDCPWDFTTAQGAVKHTIIHKNTEMLRWMAANGGHVFHSQVRLDLLRRELLHTPSGPLPDQLVPDATWVRTLMRWRKVKLLVRAWEIGLFWQREARKRS